MSLGAQTEPCFPRRHGRGLYELSPLRSVRITTDESAFQKAVRRRDRGGG
jgi:hypothetical protein